MANDNKIKAAFLDRDNTVVADLGYNVDPSQIQFMPTVIEGLLRLQNAGFTLFIVTNQSGIARGFYSEADFKVFQAALHARLLSEGVTITADYFCPHLPEANCECRKPKPGMLVQAIREWNIDPAASVMIGDRPKDALAARAAGARGAFVPVEPETWPRDAGPEAPSFTTFLEAADWACYQPEDK